MHFSFIEKLLVLIRLRQEPEGAHRLSDYIWRAYLFFGFFAFVITFLWAGYLLYDNSTDAADATPTTQPQSQVLSKTDMETLISAFAQRRLDTQAIIANPVTIVDPSLKRK